jgi:hypothetical protein
MTNTNTPSLPVLDPLSVVIAGDQVEELRHVIAIISRFRDEHATSHAAGGSVAQFHDGMRGAYSNAGHWLTEWAARNNLIES